MMSGREALWMRYAETIVRVGVNLQPGQCLRIGAQLGHRALAWKLVEAAYTAGARFVQVDWLDTPSARTRLLHSEAQYLDYYPEFEVARHRQMVDERWARLALTGEEFPDIFDDVDPARMRQVAVTRSQKLKFYMQRLMANEMQWCVAAAPTAGWAHKVFPDLGEEQALDRLGELVLQTCRIDHEDPAAAWRQHDLTLKQVGQYLIDQGVTAVHFVDTKPGADGKPNTDLTVGLTDRPRWIGGSSSTPQGNTFMPNMPTEEVFTTPHRTRTSGYARTSKPGFPFDRRVDELYVRFEAGQVVEFRAESGQEVMAQFFEVEGTRYLGEVSLVDVRSPVNQANILFYDTLFDENAACHIAFGEAYPEGIEGGGELSQEELAHMGANRSDMHVDVMIGTPTMDVTGICADGRKIAVMAQGKFVAAVAGEESA